MIPVNDKDTISADPGSHSGQYYWPGYEEVTTNQHMICLGCTTWPGPRTSNQDAINKMHAQGALAIVAHPNFGNYWQPADVLGLVGVDGIEAANGQGYLGWPVWDALLGSGQQVIGTGANDLYARGYAEVMFINSPTNSMADLLANFKIGNFYGSDVCSTTAAGCTIGHAFALRVTQSGNTITAAFQYSETDSTPQNPAYVTWFCGYPTAGSTCGTGASYTITGNEVYVRAVFGNPAYGPMRAWSQPIYVIPAPPAPVITSTTSATGIVGSSFTYTITATNNPTSFGASGLPAGLSVSTMTGVISGIPQAAGISTVTLSATNAGGTGTKLLTLTVQPAPPQVPVITSTTSATGTSGSSFTYAITATNNPTSFGASGLPPNLSVNTLTGLISGTPQPAGTSNVTLSATNAGGTGTRVLILTVAKKSK
jgi:PKD repeat protein